MVPHVAQCKFCSTDKIPNESQTGGSGTSETMCKAALNACEVSQHSREFASLSMLICRGAQSLVARLAPVKKKKPTATWKELVAAAAAEDISLSVTGSYTAVHQSCHSCCRVTAVAGVVVVCVCARFLRDHV